MTIGEQEAASKVSETNTEPTVEELKEKTDEEISSKKTSHPF